MKGKKKKKEEKERQVKREKMRDEGCCNKALVRGKKKTPDTAQSEIQPHKKDNGSQSNR